MGVLFAQAERDLRAWRDDLAFAPCRAAMAISRAIRVKTWPLLASVAAFFRLIVDHFE